MSRIAINGFGRIGRFGLRAAWDRDDIECVHVNEPAGGPGTAAHLLTFDSVHGRWDRGAHGSESTLTIDDTVLAFTAESDPGQVARTGSGADVVLECSGKFRTIVSLQPYFDDGVRKVIVAARSRTRGR